MARESAPCRRPCQRAAAVAQRVAPPATVPGAFAMFAKNLAEGTKAVFA
ncbi:MAG: hypothetical protein LBT53_08205 [Puniceicoccales bacterium]|nr:hypothetical protein [Puniceicoccales bacterium]